MSRQRLGAGRHSAAAALAVVAATSVGALGWAGAASAASTADAGLGATWTTAQGSWAALPMGHLATGSNTFWELLFRRSGSSRWTLVTPPGVASNGGIVGGATTPTSTTVTVAFQPALDLEYSPVARSSDAGKTWSTGTLPTGLLPVADAMASGSRGHVVALERTKGGTLVQATGSLTRWTTLTSKSALAKTTAGKACGVTALTGVALMTGSPAVGAACATSGAVGLFIDRSGSWHAAPVPVTDLPVGKISVVRLQATSAGAALLLEDRSGRATTLVAVDQEGGSWVASPLQRIQGQVMSAGIGAATAWTVTVGHGSRANQVLTETASAATWQALSVPKGTQAVVAGTSGPTALAVSNSKVIVWRRQGGRWSQLQHFRVPIEYGSST